MPGNSSEADKNLLLQLQGGSVQAFETLYKQYFGALYLHAFQKIKDREIAKDVVQDVFTTIWHRRGSLDIHTQFSSYLYQAVRNRILDFIAKEKSQQKYLDSLTTFMEAVSEPTDALLREKMLAEQIEQTLAQLSPRVREIFELSRKSYLTHKEISKRLNLSEHTVRGYMKEALRELRHKIGSLLWVLFLICIKYF